MASIADQLMQRRATLITQAQEVAQTGVAEGRDLSADEQTKFNQMLGEANALHERAQALHDGEQRAHELEESFRNVTGREPEQRDGYQPTAFGKWAREARVGDAYDLAPVPGAERRAIQSRGKNAGEESRAMSASGGVAADSVYSQLWEYAVAGSQILQAGVDVINTTDGNTLPLPVATVHATTGTANAALPVAISANGAVTLNDATLTTVNLSVSKYGYLTLVPTELVQDASFDLEGYISRAAGRELSRTIGYIAATAAIAGFTTAGVTGPTGTTVSLGNQATAGQGSDLIYQLFHSVLPEYRTGAAWVMGDPAAALIRQLKSTTSGAGVWQPALTAGDPDLLVGKPVYISPQIATMAANAKSIFFGEWSALKVRIAGGIRFERSNEYAFGNDQIAFRALVRTGAVTVDPNAVKYFANSAL
jgi:HK97 family phage major capsid protein